MKFCICVTIIGLISLEYAYGRIYSSEWEEFSTSVQPTVISMKSTYEHFGNPHLQRFQRFLNRKRRSPSIKPAPSKPPTSSEDLDVHKFDLGNDTSHNQALIHWSGNYSKVIFILTRRKDHSPGGRITHSTPWRSDNYGHTYVNQQSPKNLFDKNTVLQSYFVCPTNKTKVIFIDTFNTSRRLWVSTNEGESYTPYTIQFSIDKIEFHPDQSDWLLGYDKSAKALYSSQDLGKSWRHLQDGVTKDRYFWYVKGVDESNTVVHMEYQDYNVLPLNRYLVKSCTVPYCTPTAFQQHCDDLSNMEMDSLVVQNNYTFVQKSGAREKLFVSFKRGKFVRARFSASNEQTDFHIVSSGSGTVVVGVKHSNLDPQTDLYFSDIAGNFFTLSLTNVRYFGRKSGDDEVFTVDIHQVKAVTGTFIANVRNHYYVNQSKVSVDHGRTWQSLSPPKMDAKGVPYPNCQSCTLNLHVAMSQTKSGYYMPGMFSKTTIPGLVISHGSVGRTLEDAPSKVNLYVSNDAGQTWKEVLMKRHLFVAADHGAILVAVQMIFLKPITTLHFSNDIGRTWSTHNFSHEAINVDGLLTEPGEYTHIFTLFGHKNYRDNWKLFSLDLSPLVPRKCIHPNDFVNWTYTSVINKVSNIPDIDNCHLGMIQQFERVNSTHCLIGPDYKRRSSKVACKCSEKDYECAFGYFRTTKGECLVDNPPFDNIGSIIDDGDGDEDFDDSESDYQHSPPSKCVNQLQEVFSGLRKIPGDVCYDDVEGIYRKNVSCLPTTLSSAPTTTTTTSAPVRLVLLNISSEAAIGQELHFAVGGPSVALTVRRVMEPAETVEPKRNGSVVTLHPRKPGDYEIRAVNPNDQSNEAMLLVSFWYPIEQVHIYHPPVVEVNTYYNVTATTSTLQGLLGTSSLLGEVRYFWEKDGQVPFRFIHGNVVRFRHPDVASHRIVVTADNRVSQSTGRTTIPVKDYIEIVVLPLKSSPPINSSVFTHGWLQDLREIITSKIINLPELIHLMTADGVLLGVSFHVFVEPRLPLQATVYFSPQSNNTPPREHLLHAAKILHGLIKDKGMVFYLGGGYTMNVVNPYIINDKGTVEPVTQPSSAVSPGVIVILVILSIILVVCLLYFVRRYVSNSRWSNYFLTANPRNFSFRRSHIVTSRNQDCDPIVNDEFIEDEFDQIDGAGSDKAGTLEFRS